MPTSLVPPTQMPSKVAQSKIPFFGRSWALTIIPHQGPKAEIPILVTSDQFGPEALRVEFEINQYAFSAFWTAEFTIYNADGPISEGPSKDENLYKTVMNEGDTVIFCAGYQADNPQDSIPPMVWKGFIFYTTQDRVNVVDKRLILHCMNCRALTTQNFINKTCSALSTQFTQAQFIAANSNINIGIDQKEVQGTLQSANPQRGAQQLPRAKTYFGNPHHYLQAIADQNGLLSWFDDTNWHVAKINDPVGDVVGIYAPVHLTGEAPHRVGKVNLSLIGEPSQTNLGVNCRILLDPQVQVTSPLTQIAIQKQYIRQRTFGYPLPDDQVGIIPLSDTDQYVVVGVTIRGDTRGNPWYTDVVGAVSIQTALQLLGHSSDADQTAS